ncbi:hypothetical protein ACF08N_14015 [Streptomyces sp. NPDC015127]|uniref:ARPP-2 domain-containing protein n=1 Tax=Streptomyces sp. NPDC015127 TaxID=3364939 RepID=UPI00370180B1
MNTLDMTGLRTLPSQVWGGIRLVPLVRDDPVPGLRLHRRVLGGHGVVDTGPRTRYCSYIPHAFVADWSGGDGHVAAYGTRLSAGEDEAVPERATVRVHHRMAKRVRTKGTVEKRLRFLPLHLALEGYLSLHFGGPSVVWDEWSRQAVRQGLSPRAEAAYTGRSVPGLAEALRIFEIHPGQCGVLVYAADTLAAAFVVPHPDDYRALHPTLVEDLYGELVHQYAYYGAAVPDVTAEIRDSPYLRTLADLRAAARAQERLWAEGHGTLFAGRLLDPSYAFERVYRMDGFALWRFLPSFRRGVAEQHIGEVITDHKGCVAYLKTFRLSEAQIRRGHLLQVLHDHDWDLESAAETLGTAYEALVGRIRDAGFGTLLDAHETARRARATRRA